ncbi:MAG: diguanylate cyclase [Dehalococcoidia bacterium]
MPSADDSRPRTDRAELRRLHRLALIDDLTGLANRHAFLLRLRSEVARARRHHTSFSLVLLDLDGLKDINDTFGYQIGDQALRRFARTLVRRLRAEDLAARIGGDEFAVIAIHGSPADAGPFAQRMSAIAAGEVRRVSPRAQPVWLSAAWGMATWDSGVTDADTLFARAESHLLASKRSMNAPPTQATGVFLPRGGRAVGQELRRLLAMARHVSSTGELGTLCRAAAEQAAALVGAQMATVAVRRADGLTGYDECFVDGAWLPAAEWFADGVGRIGQIMQASDAEPLIANNAAADPAADQDAVQRFNVHSFMCLPLRDHRGQAMGVLSLSNKIGPRGFTESDIELGLAFADLVGSVLETFQARVEAEEARLYLRGIMESVQDAVLLSDPRTRRIIDSNPPGEELFGYSRGELLAMSATELLAPADGAPISGGADDGATPRQVARRRRKDGSVIDIEVTARLVQTPRGAVLVHVMRQLSPRPAS